MYMYITFTYEYVELLGEHVFKKVYVYIWYLLAKCVNCTQMSSSTKFIIYSYMYMSIPFTEEYAELLGEHVFKKYMCI